MLACLCRDLSPLNVAQELLPFGQAQTKIADLAEIAWPVDLHHVDTTAPPRGTRFDQAHNPTYAPLPPATCEA
jgi:uncharacterized protein YqjF (DUF2071 family)